MVWKTFIGLGEGCKEHVLVSCAEIQEEDCTFKWRIQKPYGKISNQYDLILVVESETKDQAFKRGTWLINNLGVEGLLYWVKEV